jgi:hypothetical protein
MNEGGDAPVRLTGRTLRQTRRICACFHSREKPYDVPLRFFKESIDCGERGRHMIDSSAHEDHRRERRVTDSAPLEASLAELKRCHREKAAEV